jgi:hypothetical protein
MKVFKTGMHTFFSQCMENLKADHHWQAGIENDKAKLVDSARFYSCPISTLLMPSRSSANNAIGKEWTLPSARLLPLCESHGRYQMF